MLIAQQYRVQPWGNFFLNPKESIRRTGLGGLSVCSDEVLLKIFDLLDPKSLATLALVSKACFCFAYFEDYWKGFVLESYKGDFLYVDSWRSTYIKSLAGRPNEKCDMSLSLTIEGFYSDLLYQSWFCAHTIIPDEWLEIDNIPRVKNLTKKQFKQEYEIPNIPVILSGIVDQWKAHQLWNRAFFEECFKDHKVIVGNYEMKFKDYIQYCDNQEDEMPLYLFDKTIFNKVSAMQGHFTIPEVFNEDLFSDLGPDRRPDYRWLIMGPTRSGSSFHKDPNCTSAWNAVIRGSKKWILYPPNVLPPGVHQSPDQSEVATSISLIEWFLNFYQDTKTTEVKPLECVLKEGEILFIPRGWWHIAMNLEESIAITQNFVSSVNLPYVLRFLKSRNTSLVSGLPLEQRETLYDDFLSALERNHPMELKEALEETAGFKRGPLNTLFQDKKQKITTLKNSMLSLSIPRALIQPKHRNQRQNRSIVAKYTPSIAMEKKIEFRNKQGEKLIGKLLDTSISKTVVLCHGYSDHKDTRLLERIAEVCEKITLSSLRFDFSGNGESEGVFEFANYLKEVEDIRNAIEFLKEQHNKEIIGLVGHSKGANDVLLYASIYDDVPLVVNLASRFDMTRGVRQRFGDEILKKVEEEGKVEVPRVTPEGKVATYTLTKKSMNERFNTNMEKAVSKIKKSRVLTIHGTKDTVIPVEDGKSIAQLIDQHELYLIEEADHNFTQDPHLEALAKRVSQFLETTINPQ